MVSFRQDTRTSECFLVFILCKVSGMMVGLDCQLKTSSSHLGRESQWGTMGTVLVCGHSVSGILNWAEERKPSLNMRGVVPGLVLEVWEWRG